MAEFTIPLTEEVPEGRSIFGKAVDAASDAVSKLEKRPVAGPVYADVRDAGLVALNNKLGSVVSCSVRKGLKYVVPESYEHLIDNKLLVFALATGLHTTIVALEESCILGEDLPTLAGRTPVQFARALTKAFLTNATLDGVSEVDIKKMVEAIIPQGVMTEVVGLLRKSDAKAAETGAERL